MKWTKEIHTRANINQWFFVRFKPSDGGEEHIHIKEVISSNGELRLSSECNSGIQKQSFGNPIGDYSKGKHEFCGPIQMPPDWKEIRERAYPNMKRY